MLQEALSGVSIVLMITIVDRGYGDRIVSMFTEEGVTVNLMTLGNGTANSEILDYLGLGETEKDILISTMPLKRSRTILDKLKSDIKLRKPGRGISFTIPITSVCGKASIKNIKGVPEEMEGECMEQLVSHELIIAVANRGYSDVVMEAAKSAGATGGTVIHARGTGLKEAEKFLGIRIQPEKEMIFIVADVEDKAAIMKGIGKGAGIHTEARAIVFSLPVTAVEGLSHITKKQMEE